MYRVRKGDHISFHDLGMNGYGNLIVEGFAEFNSISLLYCNPFLSHMYIAIQIEEENIYVLKILAFDEGPRDKI